MFVFFFYFGGSSDFFSVSYTTPRGDGGSYNLHDPVIHIKSNTGKSNCLIKCQLTPL